MLKKKLSVWLLSLPAVVLAEDDLVSEALTKTEQATEQGFTLVTKVLLWGLLIAPFVIGVIGLFSAWRKKSQREATSPNQSGTVEFIKDWFSAVWGFYLIYFLFIVFAQLIGIDVVGAIQQLFAKATGG